MSDCEINVMSKIEDLKCKICSDANINVRMTYFSIFEDLLKELKLKKYLFGLLKFVNHTAFASS